MGDENAIIWRATKWGHGRPDNIAMVVKCLHDGNITRYYTLIKDNRIKSDDNGQNTYVSTFLHCIVLEAILANGAEAKMNYHKRSVNNATNRR